MIGPIDRVDRGREFRDLFAHGIFRGIHSKRRAVITGLRDLLAAIGQLNFDRDSKALAQPFDPRLAGKIGEAGCPVQHKAQLFKRQAFRLQGAFQTQSVLR